MNSSTGSKFDFTGKVVLITGAATGIGREVARAFASHGAKLAIGDINEEAATETLRLVKEAGGEALFVKTDVSNEADAERLVSETMRRYGRLDCAFNNAGIAPKASHRKFFADVDASSFDRTIAVDLRGVFLCMKHELREMVRAGKGAIVNTASVAGVVADPGVCDYVAAKHGVIGLTKAAAIEYAAHGIRVNALAPGLVVTPMTAAVTSDPTLVAAVGDNVPLGRGARPDEMVGPVLYLCSEAASYITGQVHLADGGCTAKGMFPAHPVHG